MENKNIRYSKLLMLFGCFIALLITGCQSVPLASQESARKALEFNAPDNKANIYMVRPSHLMGSARNLRILLDHTRYEDIADDTYKIAQVNPGVHVITNSSLGIYKYPTMPNELLSRSLRIEVNAGENYFVELKITGIHQIRDKKIAHEMVREARLAIGDFPVENVNFAHIDTRVPIKALHITSRPLPGLNEEFDVVTSYSFAKDHNTEIDTSLLDRPNKIMVGEQFLRMGILRNTMVSSGKLISYSGYDICVKFNALPGRTYSLDPWNKCENSDKVSKTRFVFECTPAIVEINTREKVTAQFYDEAKCKD